MAEVSNSQLRPYSLQVARHPDKKPSRVFILEIKIIDVFINSSQLDGKGSRSLVRFSPELVSGSVWPMAVYQEMTPAVHLAVI